MQPKLRLIHLLYLVPFLSFVLLAITLYHGSDHLSRLPWKPGRPHQSPASSDADLVMPAEPTSSSPGPTTSPHKAANETVLAASEVAAYVRAIFDPTSAPELPRLECPPWNGSRYEPLVRARRGEGPPALNGQGRIDYFVAIDLRQSLPVLPNLLGSVVEAIRFLGPRRCALSIVEGNSHDGTPEVLAAIREELAGLGIGGYFFQSSDINPVGRRRAAGGRVSKLAQLRNLALQPLFYMSSSSSSSSSSNSEDAQKSATSSPLADDGTTVLFLNDVVPCAEDVLELLLQRQTLGADMTCAMDWTYVGPDPTFYDVWIARTIAGDSFFHIPADGSWDFAWNLFWNAPEATRTRFAARLPFQVFSCWNGATAFGAGPLLPVRSVGGAGTSRDGRSSSSSSGTGAGADKVSLPPSSSSSSSSPPSSSPIRFRGPRTDKGECQQGEPQLFCKDLWARGHGRIAVVPSVNLAYTVEQARKIKTLKGFVSADGPGGGAEAGRGIEWVAEPPAKVKCMPSWATQFWQAWDAGLAA
ncbi:hypothetical protein VTK73DRAFT_9590 [Phialemonium thermophilum]|uniref:Alpha-1,3-mannosyltransferase CMT1 n=1 Tax=Phialemonium thermophilum TaxID=223376 RepID=A0ABR3W1K4_9PEZI